MLLLGSDRLMDAEPNVDMHTTLGSHVSRQEHVNCASLKTIRVFNEHFGIVHASQLHDW